MPPLLPHRCRPFPLNHHSSPQDLLPAGFRKALLLDVIIGKDIVIVAVGKGKKC